MEKPGIMVDSENFGSLGEQSTTVHRKLARLLKECRDPANP
jgi:hypothetical protein